MTKMEYTANIKYKNKFHQIFMIAKLHICNLYPSNCAIKIIMLYIANICIIYSTEYSAYAYIIQ